MFSGFENMAKILVGVPSNGQWYSFTAQSVNQLLQKTQACGHAVALSTQDGSLLPGNRNELAQRAINNQCDYLFFADADMSFHPETIDHLVNQKKDIIGLNYLTRSSNIARFTGIGEDDSEIVTSEESTGNERAMMIGTGAMLINTRVLETMRELMLKQSNKPNYPWFNFAVGAQGKIIGEDYSFCFTAGELGFEVWINHDMSKYVKHIAKVHLSFQHHGLDLKSLR